MPNPYVNKVQKSDGTTIIDITDTTAVASDVAQGKYFYLSTGQKVEGTATGGGSVLVVDYPDSHGGTIREITSANIVTLQDQKQVTLTSSQQTISPDTGYDGMRSVVVTSPGVYTPNQIVTSSGIQGRIELTSSNIVNYALRGRTGITEIFYNGSGIGGMYAFAGCTGLVKAVFITTSQTTLATYLFNGDTSLTEFDTNAYGITGYDLNGCTSINTVILRKTSITSLSNINALGDTPFASGGTGGTIYIPKALYDHLGDGSNLDYKVATNWSTISGYGTITWAKIEGSYYETHYADGTEIPTT